MKYIERVKAIHEDDVLFMPLNDNLNQTIFLQYYKYMISVIEVQILAMYLN